MGQQIWRQDTQPLFHHRGPPSLPPEGGKPQTRQRLQPQGETQECACATERACAWRSVPRLEVWWERRPGRETPGGASQEAGDSERRGARARLLVVGGEDARGGRAARPSPGEARVPAARACAARRSRERALSRMRALAVSVTHQLRHRQQHRRHRPPSAATTTTTDTFSSAFLYRPHPLSSIR